MSKNGFNPMRWDCGERGCFNIKRRPKIEVFADCFPGRISFGDVDGIVEINGHALMLEWKSDRKDLPTGQRIMYERITRDGKITVIMICGDAEAMEITEIGWVHRGRVYRPRPGNLSDAVDGIKRWADRAQNNFSGALAGAA